MRTLNGPQSSRSSDLTSQTRSSQLHSLESLKNQSIESHFRFLRQGKGNTLGNRLADDLHTGRPNTCLFRLIHSMVWLRTLPAAGTTSTMLHRLGAPKSKFHLHTDVFTCSPVLGICFFGGTPAENEGFVVGGLQSAPVQKGEIPWVRRRTKKVRV